MYGAPAFVVVYGALCRERPSREQLGALALTLLGLAVVIGLPGAADRDVLGLMLGGSSGALYGAYLFFSGRVARDAAPLAVTAHVTLVCAGTFTILGGVNGQLAVPGRVEHWGLIVVMLLIPTLVALPALAVAVRRIGATRTSLLTSTDPLWAVLFATMFLGETLGAAQVLGGVLILTGAVVVQRLPGRESTAQDLHGSPTVMGARKAWGRARP